MERGPFRASILMLAYRMEKTLRLALEGALAQTVPCEIIVSDDASGDSSLEIAREMASGYAGPHRLIVRGNERNQGLCGHIDTLSKIATGDILIFMAADDVSYPQRVASLLAEFDAHPDAYAVGSAVNEIDASGELLRRGVWYLDSPMDQRKLLHLGKFVTLLGASMAMRRELLDNLPPLTGLVEDNMLTLRASLFGRVYCLKAPLLGYRRHEGNLGSTVFVRTGPSRAARRQRYERTIRMYREIADDHERCLQALPQLPAERRRLAEQIISMYRIEAESREAVLELPKRRWLELIWKGLKHPGLRRKSFERALKLAIPRSWLLS
ncbi:MAG TPA: glycosyltransferase [Steroidobacter sp.]